MQGKASPKQSTQVVDNKQFMIYESPALPLSYPGGTSRAFADGGKDYRQFVAVTIFYPSRCAGTGMI
jgi:hypothetical protein